MEKIVGLPPLSASLLLPPKVAGEPSNVKKRKKRPVNEPLNGEKEQRKANYMKKILNDDKATKAASFQKRKPTLKKKLQELQTLCGVDFCMVCYDSEGNIDMWPEERTKVKAMIIDYKKLGEKEKRECTILGILEAKKRKLEGKLQEAIQRKVDDVIEPLAKLVDELSGDALVDAVAKLDSKLKYLKERIGVLKVENERKEQFQDADDLGLPNSKILDNKAALEMADIGAILGPCNYPNANYMGDVTNYGTVGDSMRLESFDMPIEGYNSNSLFNIDNDTLSDCYYDGNTLGFGQVGTSYGALPENYLSSYWSNGNDIGITSNYTVELDQVNTSQGNNVSNGGSMVIGDYDHQVLNGIHQASPLSGWPLQSYSTPFGSRTSHFFNLPYATLGN